MGYRYRWFGCLNVNDRPSGICGLMVSAVQHGFNLLLRQYTFLTTDLLRSWDGAHFDLVFIFYSVVSSWN